MNRLSSGPTKPVLLLTLLIDFWHIHVVAFTRNTLSTYIHLYLNIFSDRHLLSGSALLFKWKTKYLPRSGPEVKLPVMIRLIRVFDITSFETATTKRKRVLPSFVRKSSDSIFFNWFRRYRTTDVVPDNRCCTGQQMFCTIPHFWHPQTLYNSVQDDLLFLLASWTGQWAGLTVLWAYTQRARLLRSIARPETSENYPASSA